MKNFTNEQYRLLNVADKLGELAGCQSPPMEMEELKDVWKTNGGIKWENVSEDFKKDLIVTFYKARREMIETIEEGG